MKKHFNKIVLAVILICVSILIYWIQGTIFKNPEEELFLLFQDLAFLPLSVLLVSLILERIIRERDKQEKLEELNIVVGAFFSELGTDAIRRIRPYIINMEGILDRVHVNETYDFRKFKDSADAVMKFDFLADSSRGDLKETADFLYEKKGIILGMFENPNLLENNRFTSMLWAVYHLMDELQNREDFSSLPASDLKHLSGDIERAYRLLVVEWIFYMRHLKEKYPYLFSLALRKSPFSGNNSVIVY